MDQSGTRLVVGLAGLALIAGVGSWWTRYEASHRATQFWGKEAGPLIAQPAGLEVLFLQQTKVNNGPQDDLLLTLGQQQPYRITGSKDLTDAPGLVHLRHALFSDSNYLWQEKPAAESVRWHWVLRFHRDNTQVRIALSDDFSMLGKVDSRGEVYIVSCRPMAATLRQYFQSIELGGPSDQN